MFKSVFFNLSLQKVSLDMILISSMIWLIWKRWSQIGTFKLPWNSLKYEPIFGKTKILWRAEGRQRARLDLKPSSPVSPVKTCGRNCPTRIMSNLFCPDKVQPVQGEQKDNKTAPHININTAAIKLLNYQKSIFF